MPWQVIRANMWSILLLNCIPKLQRGCAIWVASPQWPHIYLKQTHDPSWFMQLLTNSRNPKLMHFITIFAMCLWSQLIASWVWGIQRDDCWPHNPKFNKHRLKLAQCVQRLPKNQFNPTFAWALWHMSMFAKGMLLHGPNCDEFQQFLH
jgi:hypothetical protein